MFRFHKRIAVFVLLIGLTLSIAHAQDETTETSPIVAVADNNIYLVSPENGASQLVAERDPEKDQALDEMYLYSTPNLSQVSYDQKWIAYTAPFYEVLDPAYADKQNRIAGASPNDITLIELATGRQIAITDQASHFAQAVEDQRVSSFSHLIWTYDGDFLIFLTRRNSLLPNRVPEILVEYYNLKSGERRTLFKLDPQINIYGLYYVPDVIVVLSREGNNGPFTFTTYGWDGTIWGTVEINMTGTMDVTNGTMFAMNPVYDDSGYSYGYYTEEGPMPIPTLLEMQYGEKIPLAPELSPAFASYANYRGLRVVYSDLLDYTSDSCWEVTDDEGNPIDTMSLRGLSFPWEFAISPQGDQIAILKPGNESTVNTPAPIVILTPDGSRDLDFKANKIVWGAIDYLFAPIVHRG